MREILLVGAGGFVGAVLRYGVSNALAHVAFPLATLLVNVVGSFGLGVVAALLDREGIDPVHRYTIGVGLLGALTTFSTLSVETIRLMQNGFTSQALMSIFLNVILGLGAAWIGLALGSSLVR